MIINPNKLSSFSIVLLILSESIDLLAKIFPILKFFVSLIDILVFLIGICLFLLIMVTLLEKKKPLIFVVLFTLLLSIFIILALNLSLRGYTADGVKRYTLSIYLSVFLKYLIYLGVFSFFNPSLKALRYLKIFLLISILIPIFMISKSFLSINYDLLHDSTNRAWTLTYSDSLCLFTFLLYPSFNRFKYLITLLLLISVFLIGSRTNLITALVVLFINSFILNKNLFKVTFYGFTGVLVLFLLIKNIDLVSDFTGTNHNTLNRLFAVIELNEDLSFLERKHFERKGINDILENPVLGKFGGQLNVFGITNQLSPRWGGYIHNYLSFIRQFGLIGFNLLLVYLFASYRVIKTTKFKIFVVYLILMYFLSRSFVYPYLFISIGLWLKQHFQSQLLYRV